MSSEDSHQITAQHLEEKHSHREPYVSGSSSGGKYTFLAVLFSILMSSENKARMVSNSILRHSFWTKNISSTFSRNSNNPLVYALIIKSLEALESWCVFRPLKIRTSQISMNANRILILNSMLKDNQQLCANAFRKRIIIKCKHKLIKKIHIIYRSNDHWRHTGWYSISSIEAHKPKRCKTLRNSTMLTVSTHT